MNDSSKQDWPIITVVVPVSNEERFIEQTLGYLLDQDYPAGKLEIIVVDGRSVDSTRRKVESIMVDDLRVKLLDNPKCLSSAGRNIGAKTALGEILTFIDGHVYIPNNQILKNTVALMREYDLSVLSRPQFLDTPENNYFQRAVASARKSRLGHGLDSTIFLKEDRLVDPTSSGASYKREVFTDVGYFDEDFDAAEDVDFNYRVSRAGYQSFTSLKLAVYYYPRKNVSGLFRQMVRYGVGRFNLFSKHRIGATSGATTLALHFLLSLGLIISSLLYPPLSLFTVMYIGLYLAIVLAGSAWVAFRKEVAQFPILPIVYVTVHAGLAYGFIGGAIKSLLDRRRKTR